MKIGIITFHWGTNYGGVLQAYALQSYISKLGHEAYIINYKPIKYRKSIYTCFRTPRVWLWPIMINEYMKEKKIAEFRSTFLNMTQPYNSISELQNNPPKFDVYIAGSDQIWNPSFTLNGEGFKTSSYFLNFGNSTVKRISYAASFGRTNYPSEAAIFAKRFLNNFDAISVRETTGIDIIKKITNIIPELLPDPTLLLTQDDYNNTLQLSNNKHKKKYVFSYFLRGESDLVKKTKKVIRKQYKISSPDNIFSPYSIIDWINGIKHSQFVITNSFHGMVFSIIYHKPFIVFPAYGKHKESNDRFYTLLQYLNLEDRIFDNQNTSTLFDLIHIPIDWINIDNRISSLRNKTHSFLSNSIID